MELDLFHPTFHYTHRRKKWLLLLAAFGVSGYGLYRIYHLDSLVKKRKKLFNLFTSLVTLIELVADSTQAVGVVTRDLKEFLQSDSDEIPNSFKQISKIARSDEFEKSLVRVTQALTVGILRGYRRSQEEDSSFTSSSFTDGVLDKLFSPAGSGFVSVLVGSFAKNLVVAFYSESSNENNGKQMSAPQRWVTALCDDKCREMIVDCIQLFVTTAVSVYLDKTMDINTYDAIFSGLTNPKHGTKVRDILVSVCNGAVETFVKTSHQVITTSNLTNVNGNSTCSENEGKILGSYEPESLGTVTKERNSLDGVRSSGWVDKVSSTLSVPRNRNFVLDVTGRVTFETVRSFLDFMLRRMLDGMKKSFKVVREEVVERGLEVFRYVSMKSAIIVAVCFAFCLRIVGGSKILMPA